MDVDPDTVFPRTKIGRDHQMRDMVRHGKVKERKFDEKLGPMVKVEYLDKLDAFGMPYLSKWLPIKQTGGVLTMFSYCLKIDDFVNIKMLPNGSEDGFVDGSFYSEKNPPPPVDLDTRYFETEDGTVMEYREKDSVFNMDLTGGSAKGPHKRRRVKAGADEVVITASVVKINADIIHQGNMTTSGIHTDANGVHMGAAKERDELLARIKALEERVLILEQKG